MKKRLHRSPDRADALVMAFAVDPRRSRMTMSVPTQRVPAVGSGARAGLEVSPIPSGGYDSSNPGPGIW